MEGVVIVGALPPILDIDRQHIIEHSTSLIPYLSNQKILITGGTGFFGAWLLEGLSAIRESASLDFSLTVLTRYVKAFQDKLPHLANLPYLKIINGDIRHLSADMFGSSSSFDSIIHAATDARVCKNPQDALERVETILNGTKNILECAISSDVSRLLYISSGAVYGRQPPELTNIPESYLGGPDPLNKDSSYAEAKRMAEQLCVLYGNLKPKLSVPIARCFAFHGAHLPLDQHFAAGNFLRDVLDHQQIKILGDGTPRRSYLYGADLVIWLLHLLYRGKTGVAYNVGSDQDMSISDVARRTSLSLNRKSNIVIMKESSKSLQPERYIPDITRCKSEMNLEVRIPFDEQVRRTAQWHRLCSHA